MILLIFIQFFNSRLATLGSIVFQLPKLDFNKLVLIFEKEFYFRFGKCEFVGFEEKGATTLSIMTFSIKTLCITI